jgi:hypothetical protein
VAGLPNDLEVNESSEVRQDSVLRSWWNRRFPEQPFDSAASMAKGYPREEGHVNVGGE